MRTLIGLAALLVAGTLEAQQIVTTLVGTEWVFPAGPLAATDAPLSPALASTLDAQGRLVFADSLNHVVARLETNGAVTVIAGNGVRGFSGDGGDARAASFDQPRGVAYDRAGNLFIADGRNQRVRKVTPDGVIRTVAGNGVNGWSGDNGPGPAAAVSPWLIATDAAGNLYIADYNNSRLRKLDPNGIITTVGGTGKNTYSGDGRPAAESSFVPFAIAVDSAGRVVISDVINYRIYRIGADGIINTLAGTGDRGFTGDGGPARSATMTNVSALAFDAAGNLLLADTSNRRIRRVTPAGVISTASSAAALGLLNTLVVDPQGRAIVSDSETGRFLRLSADFATVTPLAGNSKFKDIPARTPALLATITEPAGLALGPDGTLYFSELGGHRVSRLDRDGGVTVVTGNGVNSCCLDGPAALGRVGFPAGLAVAPDGSLIIADSNSDKIRRVANGQISTVAGITFAAGYSGDGGPAVDARLNRPWGVAVDPQGNIFFSDRENNRIRRIGTNGVITTVAGNGRPGFSGDGGPATQASLDSPAGLAFNAAGELLIADYYNHHIRAVSSTGVIRTVAGTGASASNGDGGPAAQAAIQYPEGLAADRAGNIYLTQDTAGTIRRIDAGGSISTFAGQPRPGFAGDGGSPLAASFSRPLGVAADAAGNVYIADTQNNRIRVIRNVSLSTTLSPGQVTISAAAGSATSTPARVSVTSSVAGLPVTPVVNYTGARDWLTVTASSGTSPATLTLTANAAGLGAGRYSATVSVTTNPAGAANTVTVTLDVADTAPRLRLSTESMSFSRAEGEAEETAVLEIRNDGGGTLSYAAAVATGSGQWLSAAPASGSLNAGEVGLVNITANPAGLRAGTYLGSVTVTAGGARGVVPVTLTVRGGRRTILVSQTGLTFTAVAGGGSPTPQKVGILNIGTGVLDWRAAARTRFVQLSPASGRVAEPWTEVGELTVGIAHAGLAPGQYYDQIEITGNADNSPQLVTVLVNVLPEGANPGPEVTPTGMIFITKQGENPGSQTVTFNHLGKGAVTYDSSRLGTWYETAPGAGKAAADAPGRVVIQPALADLPAGVRRGVVTFQTQEDGSVRTVNLLSVVAPRDASDKLGRGAASCSAPTLRVESTALRDGFAVRVGEAVTLEVKAADECGNLLVPLAGGTGAQVIARPENGDAQVTLAHIGNGVWRGTWRPVRAAANTRLTLLAIFLGTTADVIAGRTQAGKVELSGSVQAQTAGGAPILTAGGVVHAASFETGVPVAPGSLITLYGLRLADRTGQAGGVPLPSTLNGTEVRLGNRPLPLLFTSDGQLNAQVPYNVPVDTQHQISVKRGDAIAVPETLTVASAQPGVFTKAQNGSGQGAIVKQDGVTLAEPGTPAVRGEVIIIYCSGLGPVSPAVEAGRAAPASPLSSVSNPVTVTVGGAPAQVLFAGLAPGFSGLYQINAFVPADSPSGDAVEVVLDSAGQRSRPVTIAVR